MIKRLFSMLLLLGISLYLPSCTFKGIAHDPSSPILQSLYVDAARPNRPFVVQLKRTFKMANIKILKHATANYLTLRLLDMHWKHIMPDMIYSGNANTDTYQLTVRFQVETHNGTVKVGPKTLTVSKQALRNANQLYTPAMGSLMRREIIRTMTLLLYHHLVSKHIHHARPSPAT